MSRNIIHIRNKMMGISVYDPIFICYHYFTYLKRFQHILLAGVR